MVDASRRDATARQAWQRARELAVVTGRHAGRVVMRAPGGTPVVLAAAKHLYRRELRRLNDVLAATPAAGCFWVWAGLLLGWAREGDVLSHDLDDADFAFLEADLAKVRNSVPALVNAGFLLRSVLRNNDGVLTGLFFERFGIHFDFFKLIPVQDRFRYYGYFRGVQVVFEIPAQSLEPFELFDRRWLKAKDHDRDLTALYGDWRTPQLGWRTDRDSPAIISRELWRRAGLWHGPTTDLSEYLHPRG